MTTKGRISIKKEPFHHIFSIVMILFLFIQSFVHAQNTISTAKEVLPVQIEVTLRINKIFNINSVDETYQIDGYFNAKWQDDNIKFKDTLLESLTYENEKARALITSELWFPAFEFVNVQGGREIANTSIVLNANKTIDYEERFFATLMSDMNLRSFPFDSQKFLVQIESFSHDETQLMFKKAQLFPKLFSKEQNKKHKNLIEGWDVIDQSEAITSRLYEYSDDKNPYARLEFKIEAKRVPGYYIWRVVFPLLIIILASFTMFWIKNFSAQIGVGFTLILTAVVFNFYSASILPKLPYKTFIEEIIIVGYVFIFLGILAVILNHRLNGRDENKDKILLLKHYRYGFPLVYILVIVILYFKHNINYF